MSPVDPLAFHYSARVALLCQPNQIRELTGSDTDDVESIESGLMRLYTIDSGITYRIQFLLLPLGEPLFAGLVQQFCSGSAGVAVMLEESGQGKDAVEQGMEWDQLLRPARIPCRVLVLPAGANSSQELEEWSQQAGFQLLSLPSRGGTAEDTLSGIFRRLVQRLGVRGYVDPSLLLGKGVTLGQRFKAEAM